MGRVMTRIKLTNNVDQERAHLGEIPAERIRSVEIEALVDTGATMLVLPADVVRRLGLRELDRRTVRYADGRVTEVPLTGSMEIEILGRRMRVDALVQPEGTTPLIGQIPLEGLDLVVDPKSLDVTVNPASPDIPLLDILAVA
jgi:clan AA aspartic protease